MEFTVQYSVEREQFGRSIGRFQAVQQQLAELAGEVATMRTSTDAAVAACANAGFGGQSAFAVAAAKVQAGRGGGVVARIAHQVHGAIGMTEEHSLHRVTTRLWSWREEAGDESHWGDQLGRQVLQRGPSEVWALLTGHAS